MNPYSGADFFQFLLRFFYRMGEFATLRISLEDLASDEVQVLVLSLVAIASSLMGSFLVLRKMTMLANSISHTVLLGIVAAYLILIPFGTQSHSHAISIEALFIAALAAALLTTILTQALTHILKLQEDASVGLVFTTLFALGVVFATIFTRNSHLGTEAIMGNVDALHLNDLYLTFVVALFNFAMVVLFFKELKITTFDSGFADAQGISSKGLGYLLMLLTSLTVVGAFRAVGVLLVLAFLVGPPLTARLMTDRLKTMLFISVAIGVIASIVSVALSRHLISVYQLPVSTAGLAVTLIGAIYFFSKWAILLYSASRLRKVERC